MFKKVLALALATVIAFSMVGCKKEKSENTVVKTGKGEIELANYKGLVVYADDVKCTDEEYESVKASFLSQNATTELKKKGKVKGDSIVNVDYKGEIEVNGEMVAFEGGTSTEAVDINMATDGASYIEGFVDALKGHKVGDEFTAHLKFPDDYTGSTAVNGETIALAGMDVDFTFTIHGLTVTKTPKFTDKLVKEKSGMDDVTTMKEFEEYVRKSTRSNKIVNKVWSNYIDSCKVIKYDKDLLKSVREMLEQSYQTNYNCTLEQYLEATTMEEKEWEEQILNKEVANRMIINAIAKKEKLELSDDDYKKEAEKMAKQYGLDLTTYESYMGGKDQVKLSLTAQRVQEFIVENVEEKEGSEPTTKAEETTKAE